MNKILTLFILFVLALGCKGYESSDYFSSESNSESTEINQPVVCNVSCTISLDTGEIIAQERCEGRIEPGDSVAEGVCGNFIETVPREAPEEEAEPIT